jgi:hypothetical protein
LKKKIREFLSIVEKSGVDIPGLPTRDELALSEDKMFEEEFGDDDDDHVKMTYEFMESYGTHASKKKN